MSRYHPHLGTPSWFQCILCQTTRFHTLLLAIKGLCSFHAITSGLVIVGCNNLGAPPSLVKPGAHTMQLCQCRSCPSYPPGLLVHHKSTIHFKHVKGHQDNLLSISSLPCLAQLNILADQLAKCSLLWLLQHCQCQVGLLMGAAWSLQVDNQIITADPHACIIWCLGYCAAYKYMVEKMQHIFPTGFAHQSLE